MRLCQQHIHKTMRRSSEIWSESIEICIMKYPQLCVQKTVMIFSSFQIPMRYCRRPWMCPVFWVCCHRRVVERRFHVGTCRTTATRRTTLATVLPVQGGRKLGPLVADRIATGLCSLFTRFPAYYRRWGAEIVGGPAKLRT